MDNKRAKTAATVILVATWAAITLGVAFEYAVEPSVYGPLTALVWLIVGLMWNIDPSGNLR